MRCVLCAHYFGDIKFFNHPEVTAEYRLHPRLLKLILVLRGTESLFDDILDRDEKVLTELYGVHVRRIAVPWRWSCLWTDKIQTLPYCGDASSPYIFPGSDSNNWSYFRINRGIRLISFRFSPKSGRTVSS